eukprot:1191600-Prorocentrum_minimum.AAC.3
MQALSWALKTNLARLVTHDGSAPGRDSYRNFGRAEGAAPQHPQPPQLHIPRHTPDTHPRQQPHRTPPSSALVFSWTETRSQSNRVESAFSLAPPALKKGESLMLTTRLVDGYGRFICCCGARLLKSGLRRRFSRKTVAIQGLFVVGGSPSPLVWPTPHPHSRNSRNSRRPRPRQPPAARSSRALQSDGSSASPVLPRRRRRRRRRRQTAQHKPPRPPSRGPTEKPKPSAASYNLQRYILQPKTYKLTDNVLACDAPGSGAAAGKGPSEAGVAARARCQTNRY